MKIRHTSAPCQRYEKWETDRLSLRLWPNEDRHGCRLFIGRKDGDHVADEVGIPLDSIPELVELLAAASPLFGLSMNIPQCKDGIVSSSPASSAPQPPNTS
jgi:hypothetical protein